MRTVVLSLLWAIALPCTYGAAVDTVQVYSRAMSKKISNVVIHPETAQDAPLPVLYLLHGAYGSHVNWITRVPEIQEYADQYQVLIVCPDGDTTSWYFDSPIDTAFRYETYISRELVSHIDSAYQTIATREGRAITGLSMGGHGAFYLAFRHPDIWGAAGSMSGGMDLRPFPDNWSLTQRLGPYATHRNNWEDNSVVNMLHLLSKKHPLALIFDCGKDDFFLNVNRALKQEMDYRNIPHTYIERPGAHNWDYWREAVQYQLLFFEAFFRKQTTSD